MLVWQGSVHTTSGGASNRLSPLPRWGRWQAVQARSSGWR